MHQFVGGSPQDIHVFAKWPAGQK